MVTLGVRVAVGIKLFLVALEVDLAEGRLRRRGLLVMTREELLTRSTRDITGLVAAIGVVVAGVIGGLGLVAAVGVVVTEVVGSLTLLGLARVRTRVTFLGLLSA